MSNADRAKARYLRRKAKREEKRKAYKEPYDNFDNVADPDKLMEANDKAQNTIRWKTSPQRYEMRLTYNVLKTSENLYDDIDVRKGFITFTLIERGKVRHITSVHFGERVPQKALCHNVLVPILSKTLIYNNGACLKDKGYTFSVDQLVEDLEDFYKENGNNEGYILLLDLSNYFGSIPHDELKKELAKKIDDIFVLRLAFDFIDSFPGEYGLGLGSETCQIEAVFYPNPIDHYIKDQLRTKGYGRYNDDSYLIGKTREELEHKRDLIVDKYAEKGLTVNLKKTKIVKLDSPEFKFLKNKMKLDDEGTVVIRPAKESVVRMRRKLKKLKNMYDQGEVTFEQVNSTYQSWRGYMGRKNAYRIVSDMDKIFKNDFVIPERARKNMENTKKQLAEHPMSKRQQKRAKQRERIKRKQELIENGVPTLSTEDQSVDKVLEEKFEDGSNMTQMIGRGTRAYQRQKKKGRTRIAQHLREQKPDSRMKFSDVVKLKEDVEREKKEKEALVLKHLEETHKSKPKNTSSK